ncbi:MAG: YHS domain-containing protein [Spirochaetota bacterium]|nr:YHS domain-containing protein [Spirochaetota bacterium]
MGKTFTFFLILSFALFSFSGISCKEDVKLGDAGGQIKCPVMGGNIDKNSYQDYKGKRVYFCCPACKEKFDKDPDKYMKKLEGVKLDDVPAEKGMHKGHSHEVY